MESYQRVFRVDGDLAGTMAVGTLLRSRQRVENDSTAAVEKARVFQPDVIPLDVDSPRLHGGDVARLLDEDRGLRGVPITLTSPLITAAKRSRRAGHRDPSKTSQPEALLASVESALT